MNIQIAQFPKDLEAVKKVAHTAFSQTPDSSLDDWFSFEEMLRNIQENWGVCFIAKKDDQKPVGIIYAQQESPINGKESLEK